MIERPQIEQELGRLIAVFKQWDDEQANDWTEPVCECLKSLADLVDTMEIEENAHALVLRIDDFLTAANDYLQRRSVDMQYASTDSPTDLRWQTPETRRVYLDAMETYWPAVKLAMPLKKHKPPETIAELQALNVNVDQICRIYNFITEDGMPDRTKLQRHQAEAVNGKSQYFDPDNFVPWQAKKTQQEIAEQWASREQRLANAGREIRPRLAGDKQTRQAAAESIESLAALPGITTEQIARMKMLTVEQVEQYLADAGIALEHGVLRYVKPIDAMRQDADIQRRHLQEQLELRRMHTYPEFADDVDARVRAMLQDDRAPKKIQKALALAGVNITYQRITLIAGLPEPTAQP